MENITLQHEMGVYLKKLLTSKQLFSKLVWLASRLIISKQNNSVCSQGCLMLKNSLRLSFKTSSIYIRTQLFDYCMLRRLNFCNALYFNLPIKELYKLQKLPNVSARFIFYINGI